MKVFLNQLLAQLTDNLDITESQENSITKAYNAVADWLNRNDSPLNKYNIFIYPQGSMKLGTVVKPLLSDDYDVDMVCLLQKNFTDLSCAQIKKCVGDGLKSNETYNRMLDEEGKRCWTLQYSDNLNYHMDILPAIVNCKDEDIFATNKAKDNTYSFIRTNPKGYAEWFKNRMITQPVFSERGKIESIPEYPKKTVLQKTIQLLKRHRDVMFSDNQEDAPISIILTTILANNYNHDSDISSFLDRIVSVIDSQVEIRKGVYWVQNPVNPSENFAENWAKEPKKKDAFFNWTKKFKSDYVKLLASNKKTELLKSLYDMFGQQVVDRTSNDLGGFDAIVPEYLNAQHEVITAEIQRALDVPHRENAPWKLPSWNIVKIEAKANGVSFQSDELLNKGMHLEFKAIHNTQRPYSVKWQITNTGEEARREDSLRGGFYNSDSNYDNVRMEKTLYSGLHYVQCFIIKRNQCVAKSKVFIVRIK